MNKDLFSDLEDLGFDDIENIDLFNDKKEEKKANEEEIEENSIDKEKASLYDREATCPVCNLNFKVKAVKKGSFKPVKRDSDSFVYYSGINPYFYDVWLCNNCGYTAMEADFLKIKPSQIPLISENISVKWQGKLYPDTYDVNVAIERYKLALLNYFYMKAPASKKAMTCLKLAWMYRIQEDKEKELAFIKQAIEGFESAYSNEAFPIYKMDKFSVLYILGELNRRAGDYDKAISWFSQIIITPGAPQRVKEKARDQRDLINEALAAAKKADQVEEIPDDNSSKKEGFFSKFFKK